MILPKNKKYFYGLSLLFASLSRFIFFDLYILFRKRQNIFMEFIIISIILSIFIIPLSLSVKLYISFNHRKIFFKIYLFGFVKIKTAYFSFNKGNVFLHLSNSKAIMFSIKDILNERKNIDIFDYIQISKFEYSTILNVENSVISLFLLSVLNIFNGIFYSVQKTVDPLFKFKGNCIMLDNPEYNGIFVHIGICFNIITFLTAFIFNFFKECKNE